MAKMLFIEGFPMAFAEQQLKNLCAPFGQVLSVSGQRADRRISSLWLG
jgi:hypothetical protein